jgi:hypothetical protein
VTFNPFSRIGGERESSLHVVNIVLGTMRINLDSLSFHIFISTVVVMILAVLFAAMLSFVAFTGNYGSNGMKKLEKPMYQLNMIQLLVSAR